MGSQVRVLYRAPPENLGITMVPRFFFTFSWKKRDSPLAVFCGIWGYFRAILGLLVAKVLQIFSPLYPLCHKGLRDFAYITCCKSLKPTPSEMLHALSRWFVFPSFTSALLLTWIIFSRKSISFQRSAIISPRRIPVFRAIIAKVFALLFFILNFQFNEQEMMNT